MNKAIHAVSVFLLSVLFLIFLAISFTPIVGVIPYKYGNGALIYVMPVDDYSEIKSNDSITYKLDEENNVATNVVFAVDAGKEFFYINALEYGRNNGMENTSSAVMFGDTPVVPVAFDSVIGKTVVTLPFIGFIAEFITMNNGLIILGLAGLACSALVILTSDNKK